MGFFPLAVRDALPEPDVPLGDRVDMAYLGTSVTDGRGLMVVAAAKAGLDQHASERERPRVDEIPFETERQRMVTVHRTPEGNRVACAKGAQSAILERCCSRRFPA